MNEAIAGEVRRILAEHARLAVDATQLSAGDDLYRAGLTSHASVTVMLACEDAFDVEFTPAMLSKRTFTSVEAITAALDELGATASDVDESPVR